MEIDFPRLKILYQGVIAVDNISSCSSLACIQHYLDCPQNHARPFHILSS